MLSRRASLAGLAVLVLALGASPEEPLRLTHGIAVGDVTADGALVWARASRPATILVEVAREPRWDETARSASAEATAATDGAATVRLEGLVPATRYHVRVRARDGATLSEPVAASFRTAPAPDEPAPVRFVVAGDLGGQRYCRDAATNGYAIFERIRALAPDFLVANGDFIYADGVCPPERPDGRRNLPGAFPSIRDPAVDWTDAAAVREVFLEHWRYNRADPYFQALLREVPLYVQWDDHEVVNDFGGTWERWTEELDRPGFPTLVREGRRALFDFHPIGRDAEEPFRIYRSFRWGREAELFLLDARSYRSLNDLPDRPETAKTLLGPAQLRWLEEGLVRSDATWKIVSSDVPLGVPTGFRAPLYGRDAWANGASDDYAARTGFERELLGLLETLDARDVANVVFVATDVHFALAARYAIDADGDGDVLVLYEFLSGPLSAVRMAPTALDPTLRPRILYAEGDLFNFSFVRIEPAPEGGSRLVAEVVGEDGRVRPGSRVAISASR